MITAILVLAGVLVLAGTVILGRRYVQYRLALIREDLKLKRQLADTMAQNIERMAANTAMVEMSTETMGKLCETLDSFSIALEQRISILESQ